MSAGERLARAAERVRQALSSGTPDDPCWPCSMNRCGDATKVNTCSCCRAKHRP